MTGDETKNVNVDFIVAGFPGCGAVMLQQTLPDNYQIYLPESRESFYLKWADQKEHAESILNEIYYADIRSSQKAGLILTDGYDQPERVHQCFGEEVKILFVVRDPVEAVHTSFKLQMRCPTDQRYLEYFRRYHHYGTEMIDAYVNQEILSGQEDSFDYEKHIQRYRKYFSSEQILVVSVEEMVRHTESCMNRIQEFLGVRLHRYNRLPQADTSMRVAKNYRCAKKNYKIYQKWVEMASEPKGEERKKFLKYKRKMFQKTMINSYARMSSETREKLEAYYRKSYIEFTKKWNL